MAKKYVDHGLYPAYNATPVFGTCQEGDGMAPGAAAVATVSIDLSAYSAAAGAQFAVGGATLTCVASGAAANQFNAGAGATLAANLATAINQASNTAVINTTTGGTGANPLFGWPTNTKLQDILYATATGAMLNIQTRCGSSLFNGTSYFAAVSTGLTGGSQINSDFAGGASGAWGYLFTVVASTWRSSFAQGSYGVLAANRPFAGNLAPGDWVHVRSKKVITLISNSSSVSWTMGAMGTAANPVVFEFDDGLTVPEWAEDAPDPILKITQSVNGNSGYTWLAGGTTFAHIKGKKYASGQRNIVLESTATASSLITASIGASGVPVKFECIEMSGTGTAACSVKFLTYSYTNVWTEFVDCRFYWPTHNNTTSVSFLQNNAINTNVRVRMRGCEFEQGAPTVAQNPVLSPISGGGSFRVDLEDCKFLGFVPGSRLLPISVSYPVSTAVTFKNCDFGNITLRGPGMPMISSTSPDHGTITSYSKLGAREFFCETRAGWSEWNASRGFPLRSAKLLDDATGWVIYAVASIQATNIGKNAPFDLPAINVINPLATGNRTVTLHFATESSVAWTKQDISCSVSYVNSAGQLRVVDSYDGTEAALSSDVLTIAEWTPNNGTQVVFGAQTFTPYKFVLVAPDMAANTELSVVVRLHTAAANETIGVLVDPNVEVA